MLGGSRWIAALLASLTLVNPALAEPKSPTERDKRIAGDLVKKAIARSQAGDHAAAIATYLQAYSIIPNSVLLSNIGSEHQQDGEPAEALRYFCMYLEKDPTGTNAPYARQQARQLQIELGNADDELCAPPESAPEPRPEPKPRRKDAKEAKDAKDAEASEVTAVTEVATGTALLEPRRTPDQDAPARAAGGSTLRYLGIAAGVSGLAGLGLGVYAGLEARQISDEITAHDPTMPWTNVRDLEQRGQRYENLQIAGLVAGGVLVTSGVILFLVGRSPDPARDQATVGVAPTRSGLAVFGRF